MKALAIEPHPALNGARACIFDAGGTLVHPDWPRLSSIAAEVANSGFALEELSLTFRTILTRVGIEMQDERFISSEEMKRPHWIFNRVYHELGLDETICKDVMAHVTASHLQRHLWCVAEPSAPMVLSQLKQRGFLLGVISNTEDGRLFDSLTASGIADIFDLLIDSQIVGYRKPEAAIFQLALDKLGLDAHEATYIGDTYHVDALGARAAGLRGILLDPLDLYPESLCPRIKSLDELICGTRSFSPPKVTSSIPPSSLR
ncbi:MAG TPA: HAD family hydrolase [Pyrinomonadaceae bacterium]